VIALSRYRAQLGRGKRLRRADALFESADPAATVRSLPGDELYYIVHESPREALDVLVHATANQVQAVLDFALWERDDIPPARLAEWLQVLAEAPYDKIGEWLNGLDVELVAFLLLRTSTIYDLSEGEAPDEPEGTFYPTPDRLFVLDVRGLPEIDGEGDAEAEAQGASGPADSARAMIRIIDSLYRSDRNLARRLLVGARAELPSQLQEMAFRWRAGRMADLGFADPWEALEVYRELDPATVQIGAAGGGDGASTRVRPLTTDGRASDSLRAPRALIERLSAGASPFAAAAAKLATPEEVAELHFALVALGNRVLAADRITPGDDAAVEAVLQRLHATLDIAVELLARGDDQRAVEALRTVALVRLFRLGVSLIGKVRKLGLALRRQGPFAALGASLFEDTDAAVVEAVTQLRPMFPRVLDDPPMTGERPFGSIADIARATLALKEVAAAQALLFALGVRPEHLTPEALEGVTPGDAAAIDAGLLGRTALVGRLLAAGSSTPGDLPTVPFAPLTPEQVSAFEQLTGAGPPKSKEKPRTMKVSDVIRRKVKAIVDAIRTAGSPGGAADALGDAASKVVERWTAGLVPLEPVLVRKTPPAPRRRPSRRR
jgi:hypothetical protein